MGALTHASARLNRRQRFSPGDTPMPIDADEEVSLFVRDPDTGRLVFNSKAIEALGLCPAELTERGYALDNEPPDRPTQTSAWLSSAFASTVVSQRRP